MSLVDLVVILLALIALFDWGNYRRGLLRHTIGLLVMSLCGSFVQIAAEIASRSRLANALCGWINRPAEAASGVRTSISGVTVSVSVT